MDTIMNLESLQIIEPNFALVYAKLVRHITAARIHLLNMENIAARRELDKAMRAIEAFETPLVIVRPCPPSS
jgi:hypothetical protein